LIKVEACNTSLRHSAKTCVVVIAVVNSLQRCVRFDRPNIWTPTSRGMSVNKAVQCEISIFIILWNEVDGLGFLLKYIFFWQRK